MQEKLSFHEWSELVCGKYRIADESILQNLWEKDWLPQQAIEHLQRTKQFRRRFRHFVPFWEAWKGHPAELKRRQRALNWFQIECRMAEALMKAIRECKKHRLEPAHLQRVNKIYRDCALRIEERERLKRERKRLRAGRREGG